MVSSTSNFIDWSQLVSELDFAIIAEMNSPLLEPPTQPVTSFADLLAPLGRDTCHESVHQIELQLQIVMQTLAMLESQTFDGILHVLLQTFALKVGELLNADRTTVFLVDQARQELWSTVAESEYSPTSFEIRLPLHQGIAGEVVQTKTVLNVPFDFYDDRRSAAAKKLEAQTGYRTYTLMALPVMSRQGEVLAVIEVLNKQTSTAIASVPLIHRIDLRGFTNEDEAVFASFQTVFRLILESSQAFYQAAQRQKSATLLVKATQALNYSGSSLQETVERVNKEAQHLIDADHSAIWLFDAAQQELWTRLDVPGGWREVRSPLGQGYIGQVAKTGAIINLPCDIYERADSHLIRDADRQSHYRTFSLLCIPMFDTAGRLIAVTQLFNKYRSGTSPIAVRPDQPYSKVPTCFQTSFTDEDEFFMLAFNIHAGAAIERALEHERLLAEITHLRAENDRLKPQSE
ncbi:MAG: GAF domain-containing protein [Leptolyngbyaceae cyanobacterium]